MWIDLVVGLYHMWKATNVAFNTELRGAYTWECLECHIPTSLISNIENKLWALLKMNGTYA
jgi:hypothetical protein